ncbi:MAG: hypothetical protein D3923_04930 [Candidatus Electrothrix sp. AR3]|nr:hypothetical protein [Candidatus Electrothrix sp. AR3]
MPRPVKAEMEWGGRTVLEQTANLPIMSVSRVLWLASLRSYSLIRPEKKQIRTAGEDQGTTQVYSWPETERISPLCPQEWQKEFFELDLVGMRCPAIEAGRTWWRSARGNESGGLDQLDAW